MSAKNVSKKAAKKATKKVAATKSSRTSRKEAKKGSNIKPTGPDHKDVVELATRLVSAQIMASSYHDTAAGLVREIRQMTYDVIEVTRDTIRLISAENGDPGLQIGLHIKNKLRMDNRPIHPTRMLEPMSHPDLDRLFQSAMRRAYVMLSAPYDPDRIVFAEQIFSPFEVLTQGAIRLRLTDFRWPNLKSRDPVFNLMRDVNSWFVKHLVDLRTKHQCIDGKDAISATNPNIPIQTRIEAEAARLSWLLQKVNEADDPPPKMNVSYRALSSALSDFTSQCRGKDFFGSIQSMDATERNNLIIAMFNPRGPQELPANTRSKHRGQSESGNPPEEESFTTYQPWAIFRYLRRHGRSQEDKLGNDLNNRLRTIRSELNPDKVPDIPGIYPAEYRFGPLHEKVESLLEELENEQAHSDAGWNSDELELHGSDHLVATELDRPDKSPDSGIPKF